MKEMANGSPAFGHGADPEGRLSDGPSGKRKERDDDRWPSSDLFWRRSTMMVAVRNTRFTYESWKSRSVYRERYPPVDGKEIDLCGTRSGEISINSGMQISSTVPEEKPAPPFSILPGFHYECRILYKTPLDPKFFAGELISIYPQKDYHTPLFRRDPGLLPEDDRSRADKIFPQICGITGMKRNALRRRF